jgi:hypothetical protein
VQNGEESAVKPGPKPQREREVRTMSSVGDRCKSSLGVSDGTGAGISKIEEVDDGALSIRMVKI